MNTIILQDDTQIVCKNYLSNLVEIYTPNLKTKFYATTKITIKDLLLSSISSRFWGDKRALNRLNYIFKYGQKEFDSTCTTLISSYDITDLKDLSDSNMVSFPGVIFNASGFRIVKRNNKLFYIFYIPNDSTTLIDNVRTTPVFLQNAFVNHLDRTKKEGDLFDTIFKFYNYGSSSSITDTTTDNSNSGYLTQYTDSIGFIKLIVSNYEPVNYLDYYQKGKLIELNNSLYKILRRTPLTITIQNINSVFSIPTKLYLTSKTFKDKNLTVGNDTTKLLT